MAVLEYRIDKASGYAGVTIDLCYSNEYRTTTIVSPRKKIIRYDSTVSTDEIR